MPNPLMINVNGTCCKRSACDEFDCPSKLGCSCDAGQDQTTNFCDDKQNKESSDGNLFDCSKSTQANDCASSITPGTTTCDCLVQECNPLSKLLLDQRTPCVTECE